MNYRISNFVHPFLYTLPIKEKKDKKKWGNKKCLFFNFHLFTIGIFLFSLNTRRINYKFKQK